MNTSQPEGYLAVPEDGSGPGVLVLHAWWGLNNTIRELCDRLAGEGFTAFAPDLYHGKVADTIDGAETLMKEMNGNYQQARDEISEAAAYLLQQSGQPERGLAVIGFSLGAYYAVDLSISRPEQVHSVVLFYGVGEGEVSHARAAYLGHFAENDPFEPREGVDGLEEALKGAGRPVTFYHYPGAGHWFFEPDRQDAYAPEAAQLAWERTLAFLQQSAVV